MTDETMANYSRNAWLMTLFATLGVMFSVISTVMINTGLFIGALQKDMGWSRAEVVASLSIGALVMAVANPFMGQLVDRIGTKRLLIFSQLSYGLATALIPALVAWKGLSGFYLGFALVSALGAGSTIVGYIRLLSGWFSGPMLKSRGLALGCCSAGVPLGAAITGPAVVYLIAEHGWQQGFYVLALLPILVSLPISIFLIKEAPVLRSAATGEAELPGLSLTEASRTRHFWMLILLVFLISTCLQGQAIHMAPFMSDEGLPVSVVAFMVGLIAGIGIPARLLAGFLFDRYFAPFVGFVVFLLPAIGALLMGVWPSPLTVIIGAVLLGIGQGAESDLIGYLVSRYFGLRHSGRIFGTIYGAFMIGIATGPYVMGRAHDFSGSYQSSFIIAFIGLCAICFILLRLPRFPKEYEHPGRESSERTSEPASPVR